MQPYGFAIVAADTGNVIHTIHLDPELLPEKALIKARREAELQRQRWEASDQFIGRKISVVVA